MVAGAATEMPPLVLLWAGWEHPARSVVVVFRGALVQEMAFPVQMGMVTVVAAAVVVVIIHLRPALFLVVMVATACLAS
ncbi:hypothetical protein [Kosakonia sp. H7A]|uniref:hypothetical protein n=1 Tax=Kosakonia sp. H7A TaxID=2054598 RepID=UPI001304A157|nr:hypothetical protein [Kosakonia sp. H7A]